MQSSSGKFAVATVVFVVLLVGGYLWFSLDEAASGPAPSEAAPLTGYVAAVAAARGDHSACGQVAVTDAASARAFAECAALARRAGEGKQRLALAALLAEHEAEDPFQFASERGALLGSADAASDAQPLLVRAVEREPSRLLPRLALLRLHADASARAAEASVPRQAVVGALAPVLAGRALAVLPPNDANAALAELLGAVEAYALAAGELALPVLVAERLFDLGQPVRAVAAKRLLAYARVAGVWAQAGAAAQAAWASNSAEYPRELALLWGYAETSQATNQMRQIPDALVASVPTLALLQKLSAGQVTAADCALPNGGEPADEESLFIGGVCQLASGDAAQARASFATLRTRGPLTDKPEIAYAAWVTERVIGADDAALPFADEVLGPGPALLRAAFSPKLDDVRFEELFGAADTLHALNPGGLPLLDVVTRAGLAPLRAKQKPSPGDTALLALYDVWRGDKPRVVVDAQLRALLASLNRASRGQYRDATAALGAFARSEDAPLGIASLYATLLELADPEAAGLAWARVDDEPAQKWAEARALSRQDLGAAYAAARSQYLAAPAHERRAAWRQTLAAWGYKLWSTEWLGARGATP